MARERREDTIVNKLGLHARAAAKLVTEASGFAAEIKICKGEQCVNAKSIMGVMMLAASRGTVIEIEAEGSDAPDALEALERLIGERFGEPE